MRAYLIYVNDTPLAPETPLTSEEAIAHFRDQTSEPDDDAKVEIREYSFDTDTSRL